MSPPAPAPGPATLRELRGALADVAVCQGVGAVSGLASAGGVRTWLPTLDLPRWQPPGSVFGPVWTVLYTLMGVASHRLRSAPAGPERTRAQQLFALQLILNGLWSYVFFRRRSPLGGLVDVLALLAALALTVRAAARVSRPAALLLVPYLLWVAFATALTAEIWRRNRAGRR